LRRTIASIMGFKSFKIIYNNKISYEVDEQSNIIITNWLKKYSYFKIYETNTPKLIEEKYIGKYQPPLNIEDCNNGELTTLLSSCRKIFRDSDQN
ncbi:GIY-YIG nuclease family protein, partial [Cloacibacillus porcorum]|uniref:GIY-YIG nuclease family protein n=1 Tax=Cloacibacillus porcorum TaxID=1197717 RepID=UPI0023EF888B